MRVHCHRALLSRTVLTLGQVCLPQEGVQVPAVSSGLCRDAIPRLWHQVSICVLSFQDYDCKIIAMIEFQAHDIKRESLSFHFRILNYDHQSCRNCFDINSRILRHCHHEYHLCISIMTSRENPCPSLSLDVIGSWNFTQFRDTSSLSDHTSHVKEILLQKYLRFCTLGSDDAACVGCVACLDSACMHPVIHVSQLLRTDLEQDVILKNVNNYNCSMVRWMSCCALAVWHVKILVSLRVVHWLCGMPAILSFGLYIGCDECPRSSGRCKTYFHLIVSSDWHMKLWLTSLTR